MTDYYAILDVPSDAPAEEIRRNYHRLALLYHPDKAGPAGAVKFKEIQTAYEVLSNPEKRSIYDRYGAAAVDNPVSDALMQQMSVMVAITLLSCLLFLLVSFLIIFVAFISAYVDGHLESRSAQNWSVTNRSYWNYVKVFSPLFAADILLGLPTIGFLVLSVLICRPLWIGGSLTLLSFLVVTIVVPIAKDHNDRLSLAQSVSGNALEGDYRVWRVWLTPLYIASALFALVTIAAAAPTRMTFEKLKAYGMEGLWRYTQISFALCIVRGLCPIVFAALIACRADGVITTDYFVVVGMPFFVFSAVFLVDLVLVRVYLSRAQRVRLRCTSLLLALLPGLGAAALLIAAVAMVSRRLNDVSHQKANPLALAKALSPVYVLLALPFLLSLLLMCSSLCSIGAGPERRSTQPDSHQSDEDEKNNAAEEMTAEATNGNDAEGRETHPDEKRDAVQEEEQVFEQRRRLSDID